MPEDAVAVDLCVVGAGPAGLAAAEVAAEAGLSVLICDAMPSVGRKFLMAGKSGLNLTKVEPLADFEAAYSSGIGPSLAAFGQAQVVAWAEGLGQPVFEGSTGRVFPKAMKASPLLRAWLGRLAGFGVEVRTRQRWVGWDGDDLVFKGSEGSMRVRSKAVVLALGGASWRRLGSDGAWSGLLQDKGVSLVPFQPANMGFLIDWSAHMTAHFGTPVKGTSLRAGASVSRGEWIVSAQGIEGGGIYEVSHAVRDGADLTVDLVPDMTLEQVVEKLNRPRGKKSMANHLRRAVSLDGVRRALLMEWARPLPEGAALAARLKALPVPVKAPRPLDEAISVAGGVDWTEVDPSLMLRAVPGVFVAGEMLDWEAPTGGYLLTGCLATGRLAGQGAVEWARSQAD